MFDPRDAQLINWLLLAVLLLYLLPLVYAGWAVWRDHARHRRTLPISGPLVGELGWRQIHAQQGRCLYGLPDVTPTSKDVQ